MSKILFEVTHNELPKLGNGLVVNEHLKFAENPETGKLTALHYLSVQWENLKTPAIMLVKPEQVTFSGIVNPDTDFDEDNDLEDSEDEDSDSEDSDEPLTVNADEYEQESIEPKVEPEYEDGTAPVSEHDA